MTTEGDLEININVTGGAAGAAQADQVAASIQGVEQAQTRLAPATARADTSLRSQVRSLNTVQNLAFRGFINIGRLAGANSALAHTINAVAFGADIAFGALQAYIALTRKVGAASAASLPSTLGLAVAETGPAAPWLGPAIVATVLGSIAAVALAVASTPGAAGGAIVTEPTLLRVGERGKEGVFPLPPGGGGFGGGNFNIIIGSRPLRDALTEQSTRDWLSGRA